MTRPTTSNEIRQAFLDYFAEQKHEVVASAPLPQYDNPTLLFTNAGMNQFTDVFLGREKRSYVRAASSQKCMRVQGKHNDLENVGPSPRHHTCFEMLGNFSFGDYFKKEAIDFAWQFITGVMQLEEERLWATVYQDDDEAFALWERYLPSEKILRFDEKDNFWEMGETGPCGPNSEFFYYVGDMTTCDPSQLNADDDEEFLELWNLVFMQFNREDDGSLTPLPKPSVDTGMGLERIVRVVQKAESNYETDLFSHALDKVQELLGDDDATRAEKYVGYRVIGDHGRAATFMIADGVRPASTGAGYVLRMVIRRAARFGRKIGFTEPFLADIGKVFIEQMGEAYPELKMREEHVLRTLTQEEKKFARTLDSALAQLDTILADLKAEDKTEIPGDTAFDLLATFGLPLEITRDVVSERGFTVDEAGYLQAQEAHRIASGAGAFDQYETGANVYADVLAELIQSGQLGEAGVEHDPYNNKELVTEVVALFQDGQSMERVAGGLVEVVTAETPFYVESGGEVSDMGLMMVGDWGMKITDTKKPVAGLVIHIGSLEDDEMVRVGDEAVLAVDNGRRSDIRRNHTATHMLHRELRSHLGKHVTQAGSLVAPERLRFDFSHEMAVNRDTLQSIEKEINKAILDNKPVTIAYMGQQEAIDKGAMALFGEKYGDIVRTVTIDDADYSMELCGGLHVSETGEIGLFHFVSEGAVSAGVRRVEAVTGQAAQAFITERMNVLDKLSRTLNAPIHQLEERLDALLTENKNLQKELETLQRKSARDQFGTLLASVQDVNGVNVLSAQVEVASVDGLREMADWFRDKLKSGVGVFGTVNNGKPLIIATVTDDIIKRGVKAGDIVREVAKMVGGGGGGRPNLAQAGGKDAEKLPEALTAVAGLVADKLKD